MSDNYHRYIWLVHPDIPLNHSVLVHTLLMYDDVHYSPFVMAMMMMMMMMIVCVDDDDDYDDDYDDDGEEELQ